MRARLLLAVLLLASSWAPGHAENLDTSLGHLAHGLARAIDDAGLQRVGVPEFMNGAGVLGGDTGAAGHYVAEKIEECLTNAPGRRYAVVERRRLNTVLQEAKVQASGLTDEHTTLELVGSIKGLDCLIVGSLTRKGPALGVGAKVVRLPGAEVVIARSTQIPLDPDLLALFGANLVVPAQPGGAPPGRDLLIQAALQPPANALQPQIDPQSPFAVEVIVNGKAKPLYQRAKDLLVGVSRGEVYQVRLTNRGPRKVGVALQIDGLNSIGARRDTASTCRKWVLRPGQILDVPGWQLSAEQARQFVFVATEESLAARQRFTDEVGLITAAFYREAGTQPGDRIRHGLGTGAGARVESRVQEVPFTAASTPDAILTLQYDAAEVVAVLPCVRR